VTLKALLFPVQVCGRDGPHNPTTRCSISNAWVVEPGRTRTAEAIGDELV
jgi:hypothetical protein